MPGADAQQQLAEAHRRTTEAMMALRSTLRDEYYYLLQVSMVSKSVPPAPLLLPTPRHCSTTIVDAARLMP